MNLYFDNASTSFPKPISVINSANNFISNIGANPNRGSYDSAITSNRIIFECRERLCELFNFNKPQNIIFTYNATYAFNLVLNSLTNSSIFKTKPHILISKFDHNATIRPLIHLKNKNKIEVDFIKDYKNLCIDTNTLSSNFKQNTKLLVISHMSNITGSINDIEKISKICKEHGVFLILDIAQSSGVENIDLSKINFLAACFTGHKNLFSTQGIGGFIVSDTFLDICENGFLGGTGSESYGLLSKSNMPDYFEAGTPNLLGINCLSEGVNFIKRFGINNISSYKKYTIKSIYSQLININNIDIINNVNYKNQNSIISLKFKNISVDEAGYILNRDFKVCVRVGVHCSPYSQEILGVYPNGSLRISPSIFNSHNDIKYLVDSLNKVSKI